MSSPRFSLSRLPRRSSDVHCEKGGAVSINGFAGKVGSVRDSNPVVGWSFRGITGVRAKKNGRSIKRLPAFLWLFESFDTSLIKNRGFGFDKTMHLLPELYGFGRSGSVHDRGSLDYGTG